MTSNLCKLIALLLIFSSSSLVLPENKPDTTASLSGVVKGGSGTNLAVHLEPTTQSPVRYYDGYESTLKNDGSFTFTEIPPGEYRISVEEDIVTPPDAAAPIRSQITPHLAYDRDRRQWGATSSTLSTSLGADVITLHLGETRKGVVIELTRKVSFCGHVTHDIAPTDAWGRGIGPPNIVPADTSISFLHYNPEFGVLENEIKVDTNKDGSFQVTDLAPGSYFVHTEGIWYPGVKSFDQAEPVIVTDAPAASCNVDYQLMANYSCMAGEVVGEIKSDLAADRNDYEIALLSRNRQGVSASGLHYSTILFDNMKAEAAGGNFRMRACPGEYDVVLSQKQHASNNVWGSTPAPKIVFDTQHVSVSSSGTAHVVLTPHAMASIEGEVRLDKVTKEDFCSHCQSVYVSILREGDGQFQTSLLSSGNHFDFRNVTPGEYQIFITATRLEKAYLRSILVDGVEGQGSHFVIAEPKFVSMKVTLSGDLAQADGHVSPDVRGQKRWQTEGMRPPASVSGRIDGDRNATYTVRLLPMGYNSNAEANLTTQTLADGSFHFDGVPPDVYRLRAHDKDYVRFDYGAKKPEERGELLFVVPGAQIDNLILSASKHGFTNSICGHLTDTNGDSRSTRIWFRSTAATNQYQQAKEVSTDNSGYFRIDGLQADDYLLQAPDLGRVFTLSADGRPYESVPVHLTGEHDLGCGANPPLELHFPVNGGSAHSISGAVLGDLPARLGDRFLVELRDAADSSVYASQTSGKLDADHKFFLEHVYSGNYKLSIYGVYGPEPKQNTRSEIVTLSSRYFEPLRHLIATQTIEVRDQDISGIELTPLTLPAVAGTVKIQHSPANWKDFQLSDLNVSLVPHRKNGTLSAPITLNANGQAEFAIAAADPGEYEVQIKSAKNNLFVNGHSVDSMFYAQSARLNGKEVNPRFFSLPQNGIAKINIELSGDMASIHAKVDPDTSFPMPGVPLNERCVGTGRYTVILFPNPPVSPLIDSEPEQAPHLFNAWSLGAACNGFTGNLQQYWDGRIRDIPPGNYYALAARDMSFLYFGITNGGQISIEKRRLLSALATIAKPITLHAGEDLELELSDKTIDASRIASRIGLPDEPENLRAQNGQSCCSR